MASPRRVAICQRCGMGFVVTDNYREFLSRRGANVIVPVQCPTCFWKAGPMPKQRGRVKWFSSRRQYGFIVTDRAQEVFFHQKQLLVGSKSALREGQAAQFHVRRASKGLEALNVELIAR